MATIILKSNAKINMSLNILDTLENGYHDLDMVICPINFHDDIIVSSKDSGIEFHCSDVSISNEENIAYKAAQSILDYAKCDKGVNIYIEKRIWKQAGLGGGSSNAAAVLIGINKLYDLGLSKVELADLGIKLGADVPLFLSEGIARVRGIGEKVEYFDLKENYPVILIQDEKGLSTKEVFNMYDNNPCRKKVNNQALISAINERDFNLISENMHNCLQQTSTILNDKIGMIVDVIKTRGAVKSLMTGSGSAVFGIFEDEDKAKKALEKLKFEFGKCQLSSITKEFIIHK